MALFIIILPLLLLCINGILGRMLGNKGILKLINIIFMILLSISIILFIEIVIDNNILTIPLINWIQYDILNINWTLILDDLSISMMIIIISISYIVFIYSYDYLIEDPHKIRFTFYIILFVLCMIILVTSSSLLTLFIGWEGVGLSSYLLISYWYTRIEAQLGSLIALFINRIGDVIYLLGIFFTILYIGNLNFSILNSFFSSYDLILILFLIAAMAKSAQLSLHIWLPYSMEGPTPISALIHAATMVTAGIFLLIRLSILITFSYYTLILLAIIGSLTAFIGGSLAITSLDLKELIAYSTMSQLGYMITILGLQFFNLSFFHLLFHAYFKALLFLTAGSIIHTFLDLQDIRKFGAILPFVPLSYIIFIIGFLSLMGFPFSTGFYSKEMILNSSNLNSNILGDFIYLLTILSALFTIFYSFKFLLYLFFKSNKSSLFHLKHLHFYSLHLTSSLLLLSSFTILLGFLYYKWNLFYNLPINFYFLDIPLFIKWIPLFFFFFVIFSLNLIFYKSFNLLILKHQYYYKLLFTSISSFFLALSYRILFKLFDYGWIDLLCVLSGYNLINISNNISKYTYPIYYLSLFLFSFFIFLFII